MKKIFQFSAVAILAMMSLDASAQRDSLYKKYSAMAAGNEQQQAQLRSELYTLLKSDKESDMAMARMFFGELKQPKTADSIATVIRAKFPNGQLVSGDEVQQIYDEKDPVRKEKMYKVWIKRFPPTGKDRIQYDYVRGDVSTAYADAGNVQKAIEYANAVETGPWKGEGWAGAANRLVKKGYTKEAKELYKKAIDNAIAYKTTKKDEPGAGFAVIGLPGYASSMAGIYLEEKNYAEAMKYAKMAFDAKEAPSAATGIMYARALMALGKDSEAFDALDKLVKSGMANMEVKNMVSQLYVKVKGSKAGYDEYIASVQQVLAEKVRKDVARTMINQPAPGFTITDLNGNAVTSESLKGKIVILDFWATWCGPCVRSFPAMQQAVHKFQQDKDVVFLFIHTWERVEDPVADVRSFMQKNGYSDFKFMLDKKSAQTGKNPALEAFKISSIPQKFVLDRQGNIRFRISGFAGGDDLAVEELSAMIDMAKKG